MISRNKKNIFILLRSLYSFLNRRRKVQLFILFFSIIINGFCEFLTIASAIPFISILTDPFFLEKTKISYKIIFLGNYSSEQLNLIFALFFIICISFSGIFRIFNLLFSNRMSALIGNDLSLQVYRNSLYQPYENQLNNDSSKIISAATEHTNKTVSAITMFFYLSTNLIISIFIFLGLFIFNWRLSIIISFTGVILYGVFAYFSKNKLIFSGEEIVKFYDSQVKSIQEGMASIRNIILDSSYEYYLDIHQKNDIKYREAISKSQFLGISPRYLFECIGLIFFILIGYILSLKGNSSAIEVLGLAALSINKLLPAFQQIYANWAAISTTSSEIESILIILNVRQKKYISPNNHLPLELKSDISFKNVSYKYPNQEDYVLNKLNLKISSGQKIGIVGPTGSGKSTLLDLIMGLLKPSSGEIFINGKNIYQDNLMMLRWQASIAHVPQAIFLANTTITKNIALGISDEQINLKKIYIAAKKANIYDFIVSLPNGFNTHVGERGIKLSGGQRQRIGIARALYHNKKILFFDEGTSALDNHSEKKVIEKINSFNKNFTLVMIAHRISTLSSCDKIYEVQNNTIHKVYESNELNDLINQKNNL